jgi:hypothetical protein
MIPVSLRLALLAILLISNAQVALAQFADKSADLKALPKLPAEFQVTLFASEPIVRQPCSMAFDERGRLFVGMGPQYRNPKPETAASKPDDFRLRTMIERLVMSELFQKR